MLTMPIPDGEFPLFHAVSRSLQENAHCMCCSARSSDGASVDAPSTRSMISRKQLIPMERILQRILTTLQIKDEKATSRRQPYTLRFSLKTPADVARVKSLKNAGIVGEFNKAGNPFHHIRACGIVAHAQTLFLYISNPIAEKQIHEQVSGIGEILGLSIECGLIPEKYLVQVFGFQWDRKEFKNAALFMDGWSRQNGVKIHKAYWTYNKLILEFHERNDAESLLNRVVYLSGYFGWAE